VIELRPATEEDVAYLAALALHEDVAPFVSTSVTADPEALAAEIAANHPFDGEHVVFLVDGGHRAGAAHWERVNRRSRIATLSRVVIDPRLRGRGLGAAAVRALADDLIGSRGFHRVQLETYGFNDAALRTFESAGFTQEGVRRRAYWRHGEWQDGILFGRVEEDD
jgi:aminoglycoside 6'-N-acetyltransferase